MFQGYRFIVVILKSAEIGDLHSRSVYPAWSHVLIDIAPICGTESYVAIVFTIACHIISEYICTP